MSTINTNCSLNSSEQLKVALPTSFFDSFKFNFNINGKETKSVSPRRANKF